MNFLKIAASMLVPVVGGFLLEKSYEVIKENAKTHP